MNETFFPIEGEQPSKLGFVSRGLIKLVGPDPDFVRKNCPEDIGNLKALGAVAACSFGFNAAAYTSVGSHLAGHFSFPILIGGTALAAYTLASDSWNYFRCDQIPSGVTQLSQAGVEVELPSEVRNARRRSFIMRIGQSLGVSIIVAVTTVLAIYSDDTRARIRLNDQRAHAAVIQQLGEQASNDLKRSNDAVKTTTSNIALLNRQINAQLGRRRNAAGSPQLQALETRKAAEEAKLAVEKADLSKATDALRNGTSAGLQSEAGLLTQINALEQIAGDDWKIAFFILLCMFISATFDLMPMIAKMNWQPTKYARLKAKAFLDDLDAIADQMVPVTASPTAEPEPANDNFGAGPTANDNKLPESPKKPLGRPKGSKNKPKAANGSDQDASHGNTASRLPKSPT